ncbi:hypothetical protein MMC34_008552, partial [Xylographa carneopallida]|nr:hypothetical protein [Xylographa carneopallida]
MSAMDESEVAVDQPAPLDEASSAVAADDSSEQAASGREETPSAPPAGPTPELRQKLILLKIATRKRQLLDLQRQVAQRVVRLANEHNAPYQPPAPLPPPPPPPPPLPPPPAHQLFDHRQFFVRRPRAALSFSIPSILPFLPPVSLALPNMPSAAELLARMPHAYLPSTLAAASAGAAANATTSAAKSKREADVMEQARRHQLKVAEQAELRQKKEREKQRKLLRKHFLTILLKQHREQFVTFHRSRTKQQTALAKAAVKGVEGMERKKKAMEERVKKERMRALKENDMQSYLSLLEGHKNDRLTALLHQTDGYLKELGRMMRGEVKDEEERRPKPYLGKGRRRKDVDEMEMPIVSSDGLTWADRQAEIRKQKQTDGETKAEETETKEGRDKEEKEEGTEETNERQQEENEEKTEKMDMQANGDRDKEEKEGKEPDDDNGQIGDRMDED